MPLFQRESCPVDICCCSLAKGNVTVNRESLRPDVHGLLRVHLCTEPPPSTAGAPTKLHAARALAEHQTQAIVRQCNAAIR